jgi:hypothetical protein
VYSPDDAEICAFLLEGTRTGKLGYRAADGRPLVAPVWFVIEGGCQRRPDVGHPALGPSGKADAYAAGRMTDQVPGHQPPDESGGAEYHDVQLTVPAHPFIVGKTGARRAYARAATKCDLIGGRKVDVQRACQMHLWPNGLRIILRALPSAR